MLCVDGHLLTGVNESEIGKMGVVCSIFCIGTRQEGRGLELSKFWLKITKLQQVQKGCCIVARQITVTKDTHTEIQYIGTFQDSYSAYLCKP